MLITCGSSRVKKTLTAGADSYIFWSEMGSGFKEPSGTSPSKIILSQYHFCTGVLINTFNLIMLQPTFAAYHRHLQVSPLIRLPPLQTVYL